MIQEAPEAAMYNKGGIKRCAVTQTQLSWSRYEAATGLSARRSRFTSRVNFLQLEVNCFKKAVIYAR